ncbi:MAG TPA: hypothetical protein VGI82_05975 [Chitinophagaceae bacterium]
MGVLSQRGLSQEVSLNFNKMAKEETKITSGQGDVQRNSSEETNELISKLHVTEEDVNVARQIVGDHKEKIEAYLSSKRSRRNYNIW